MASRTAGFKVKNSSQSPRRLDSFNLNPIEHAEDWQVVEISGVTSPGVIAVDGIQGFKRETKWDIKQGKGTDGATLALVAFPPTEGSIKFLLWEAEHFESWGAYKVLLNYNNRLFGTEAADALDIYHPALADIWVSKVVVKSISPAYHEGNGLYSITVDFIEWRPPPPKDVVQTTNASKAISKENTPGSPPNPVIAAKQKEIAELGTKAGLGVFP